MTDTVRAALDSMTAELDAIEDPEARFRAAEDARQEADAALRAVQQTAVTQLHDAGRSWRAVGELLGFSGSRAEQIAKGR